MICEHCKSEWTPRVPEPKYCPFCKRPLAKISSARQLIELELVKQKHLPTRDLCFYSQCTKLAMVHVKPDNHVYCLEHAKSFLDTVKQITDDDLLQQEVA